MEISRATPKNSRGLRVLIVDDEPLIRWAMSETLTSAGHAVTEASDARETLQRLQDGPAPDVILLDYRLPDSNGLSLLEQVRRAVPDSCIIMMTAFGTPEVAAGAARLGVYGVIGKPLEMRDLASLIQQAYASRPA